MPSGGPGASADSAISLMKAFVLSVLVSATLAKLGEAGFNSFWTTVEHSDLTEPTRAYARLLDAANISVFVFITYFLIVLSRHLGAIYSTQILLGMDPRTLWQGGRLTRALPVVDFAATFLMFMLHYIAAYGLSEAVDGSHIALSGWPIAVVPPLLLALALDAVICIVGLITASLATQQHPGPAAELRKSNLTWLVASALEFVILLVSAYMVSTSAEATAAIVLAIVVGIGDLVFTWSYWSRIALLKSSS